MPKDYQLDYDNGKSYYNAQGKVPGELSNRDQTLAAVGLVVGVVGLLTFFCPPLPVLLGSIAIICGLLSKPRGSLALASLAVGILCIALPLLMVGVFVVNWGYLLLQQIG